MLARSCALQIMMGIVTTDPGERVRSSAYTEVPVAGQPFVAGVAAVVVAGRSGVVWAGGIETVVVVVG